MRPFLISSLRCSKYTTLESKDVPIETISPTTPARVKAKLLVSESQANITHSIVPETAKEKPAEGVVIAIGNGRVSDKGDVKPLTVKVGDKVLFGKYAGTEIKVGGEDRLILREDDILGIIED